MPQSTFDEVLEAIEHLPPDEQADLVEIVRRRLAERGRRRVIDDVQAAKSEFENGDARPTSLADLMNEIRS